MPARTKSLRRTCSSAPAGGWWSTAPGGASPWTASPWSSRESEFRLLQSLARFPGRVYTRAELVERLQGMEFEPYERTIDAHIKNLRRKLGDDARAPRLVLTVYGRGYAFAEDQR